VSDGRIDTDSSYDRGRERCHHARGPHPFRPSERVRRSPVPRSVRDRVDRARRPRVVRVNTGPPTAEATSRSFLLTVVHVRRASAARRLWRRTGDYRHRSKQGRYRIETRGDVRTDRSGGRHRGAVRPRPPEGRLSTGRDDPPSTGRGRRLVRPR
jgi:hypothetical protein